LPRICNAGYLKAAGRCEVCPAGKYSTTAGVTACQACTNAQAIPNTYYLLQDKTTADSNNCPW
jgi:hypothetical protein